MKRKMWAWAEIMDCCGLHGLSNIPPSKEEFDKLAREACERELHSYDEHFDEEEGYSDVPSELRGAMIIITTSEDQEEANDYLPELGWQKVFENRNSNSGNIVYLWVMDIDTFNEKWGAY